MKRLLATLWIGIVFGRSQAFANLNYANLQKLILSNDIKTVEQLIPQLPSEMRRNPLLVYSSHGLRQELVRPESPRTILFNEDASLIMAYTKSPGSAAVSQGRDSVEVISFDDLTKKFEMRDLVFNGITQPYLQGEPTINPALCLSCHGANPRPIFQDYNAWPGFYGSFSQHGAAVEGGKEFAFLKQFLSSSAGVDRYQFLDLSGYLDRGDHILATSPDFKGCPNLQFGKRLERLMFKRLAGKIAKAPEYPKLMPLIAFMGEPKLLCSTEVRDRIKQVYASFSETADRLKMASALISKITNQIERDFKQKKTDFFEFNLTNSLDPRGVQTLANTEANLGSDPYYNYDQEAFRDELAIMESVFRSANLSTEDVSTFPNNKTLGIYHVRAGSLYTDEQYFVGLADGLKMVDPDFLKLTSGDCSTLRRLALTEAHRLPIPVAASGIIY